MFFVCYLWPIPLDNYTKAVFFKSSVIFEDLSGLFSPRLQLSKLTQRDLQRILRPFPPASFACNNGGTGFATFTNIFRSKNCLYIWKMMGTLFCLKKYPSIWQNLHLWRASNWTLSLTDEGDRNFLPNPRMCADVCPENCLVCLRTIIPSQFWAPEKTVVGCT